MNAERMSIDTVVIGAGQSGVAMSEHLSRLDIPHVVLERHQIAQQWRTGRWDSLVSNGPAWHDRFPGMAHDISRDAFVPKDQIADYLEAYARRFNAPIRTGVEVTSVERKTGHTGFTVETSAGIMDANHVVVATGPFQHPVIPAIAPRDSSILQLHSAAYRNPEQLPPGAVLIVGAGSSGVQIADELQRADRKVYLSMGAHDCPPRVYRGRDFCWWQAVLGEWDAQTPPHGREHVTLSVSGAHGGQTVDFREFAQRGMTLVGTTKSFDSDTVAFEADLLANIAYNDASYLAFLDAADAYAASNGLDLPEEPEARNRLADPPCVTEPLARLDLAAAGVTSIIWATGYARDYGWLKVNAFDAAGKPLHQRGVSSEPGIYFVGLPWLTRRASPLIWGSWYDARYIADHIALQRTYAYLHQSDTPLFPAERPCIAQAVDRPASPHIASSGQGHTSLSLNNGSSHAVRTNNTVYVRGRTDTALDGHLAGREDPRAQAERAMMNIRQLLREAGSDLSHTVKATIYLLDPRYHEPVHQEVARWLEGALPITTSLVVSALSQPHWLLEIDVTAVIPDGWAAQQ